MSATPIALSCNRAAKIMIKQYLMHCFIPQISLSRAQRYNKSCSFCYPRITKMVIFTLFILNQFRFQKSGVKSSSTVNNSRRPRSIKRDNSHLAASGRAFHEQAGPVSPNPGPILPMLEITQPIDSSSSDSHSHHKQCADNYNGDINKAKASTVETMEEDMTCLFIRTGSMALGCRMCLNSFRDTLVRITIRMHFKPPVVLPAHAPISMMMVSRPHRTGDHCMQSSVAKPVDV